MRISLGLRVFMAPLLAVLGSCAPAPQGEPANGILVIAIDALRYDHLGVSGYDRATSPELDTLAAQGVFFEQAYAAAPWQVPAHMALLSSADPRLARRSLPPDVTATQATIWHLPDEAPHPVARFLSEGIRTAMFYDHENLAPVYGFERGFGLYQAPRGDNDDEIASYGSEAVFKRFGKWIARVPRGEPWFAYLELADLERVWSQDNPRWDTLFPARPELSGVPPVGSAQHLYFALPRRHWSTGVATLGEYESCYDGGIARLDKAFQGLRAQLEQLKRFENTTIVVVGAYGMSFGESGMLLDSGTFDDCDLHVPLIVRPAANLTPAGRPLLSGVRSRALVSTLDILPTLLELAGLPADEGAEGKSFAAALTDSSLEGRQYAYASCALQDGFAVIDKRYCFERSWPARTQDARLSTSWFGDPEKRIDVMREVLHDRQADPLLGHVRLGVGDPKIAAALAEVGEERAAKAAQRRAHLQGPLLGGASSDGR